MKEKHTAAPWLCLRLWRTDMDWVVRTMYLTPTIHSHLVPCAFVGDPDCSPVLILGYEGKPTAL